MKTPRKLSNFLLLFLPLIHMQKSKVNVIDISNWSYEKNDKLKEENKVTVGLLLPRYFSSTDDDPGHVLLDSVLPGVVLAAQELHHVLPGWSWDILVGDTACNSTTGPLQAVDMFYKKR